MAVVVLMLLLVSSFAGLAAGRFLAVLPAAAAALLCAALVGLEAGALAALATAGLAAGVQLHRVVAQYASGAPRAG
jgi:hypothetical protein